MIFGNGLEVIDRRIPSTYDPRGLLEINMVVVHHAATGWWVTPESIRRYHSVSLGWPDIGYHFLVEHDGDIFYVGDIATIRAHAYAWNTETIGVCLVGNFDEGWPTPQQLHSTRMLIANIQWSLGWFVPIVGHSDLLMNRGTHCPGLTYTEWRLQIDPRA